MELPTRTLPHNYIAIIKVFAMSLCTVSFTAFHSLCSLGKPPTLTSLQRKTLQRHCEWGSAKQHNTSETHTVPQSQPGPGDTVPYRWCPWLTFTILKLCSLGEERGMQDLQMWGPLVRIYFLVKEEEAEKWMWDHTSSSIFFFFFFS